MHSIMKAMVATGLLGIAAAAPAQLLGGRVGAGAGVGAGVNVPNAGATLDGATRAADDAVRETTRAAPSVNVHAGASTRVDRGTRCYYQPDDYYYDPVYRDGYYYCEQRGSGASVGAGVSTPR